MTRVVVIGAGLAGLTAALALAEGGAGVTVVAEGAGGLHLSPGTIDLLGYAPGRVAEPLRAIAGLGEARPDHPYARVGADEVAAAVAWLAPHLAALGYVGDGSVNMLLPSAIGVARPTALAPASMAAGDVSRGGRMVAVGLRALRDLYPRMLAENLARAELPRGSRVETRHATVDWSPLPGRADVAAPVLARALDDDAGARAALGDALRAVAEPGETILVPAVLGLRRAPEVWKAVGERTGAPVAEVATIPPSVPGMRLQLRLIEALAEHRVRVTPGPTVVGCEGSGDRITAVHVRDSARTRPVAADAVVLASGGVATGAVALDSRGVLRERALGLHVAGPPDGAPLFSSRHLDEHPGLSAGVAVDPLMRPLGPGGAPVWSNLHAAGAVVAGAAPWREKSGEGIAIATAHRAARAILEG